MSSLDLTREWLHTVLRPYTARERIISEVMDILAARRTLAVKTDAFTYNTGQTALLLLLHGTLPINYRGATYQIPLHVWIPHDYPRKPPLAFVVPTKEMGVRKGREVEPGGRVKEEVVEGWWQGWEPKSIETLLRHLAGIFSATPPVFARPPEPAGAAGPSVQNGLRGMPPQITGAGSYPAAGPSTQPPPPPSRPFQQSPTPTEFLPQYHSAPTPPPHPYPHQTHSRQSSSSYPPNLPQPQSPNGQPPIPHRPQMVPPRQGSLPPSSPISNGSGAPPRPRTPPRPMSGFGPRPDQGYPADRRESPGPRSPASQHGYHPQYQARPSFQPPNGMNAYQEGHQPSYTPHPASNHASYPSYNDQPIPPRNHGSPHAEYKQQPPNHQAQPQQPRLPQSAPPPPATRSIPPPDLLSANDDPSPSPTTSTSGPPPIPPSKPPPPSLLHLHSILLPHLNSSLPPLLSSLHASKTHLLERREDLLSGEPAIKDEMARLEAVRKVCESTGRKLEDVVSKGEGRVAELEAKGEIGVDEVVCGISIVHNQLIDLVAEDNAIDDTIYHVTRAFEAERIDLDRFLKSIRSLAKEQYMKRALIERILDGMGQKQGW